MVIDIEVSACTPSPTVDPSVRTILIGHSMGGIVAAETLLSITSDDPIATSTSEASDHEDPLASSQTFMFPYIQGVLAFDTPYLGIAPSVIAHASETHYRSASSAYSTLTEIASVFGYGSASSNAQAQKPQYRAPAG